LGGDVFYFTVLGDDPYSDEMIAAWQAEGIHTEHVRRKPGSVPGLYAIHTTADGERSFHYWRDSSPVRGMFRGADGKVTAENLKGFDAYYFSGITLSVFDDPQRDKLLDIMKHEREKGATVVFDPNYRTAGWPDIDAARRYFDRAHALATISLPTLDDERKLYPGIAAAEAAARLIELGAGEVVLKTGNNGCLIKTPAQELIVPVPVAVSPVDTTAAGDSFNAAYLHARLQGKDMESAARAAHRLASIVIQHTGAIISRSAMSELCARKEA